MYVYINVTSKCFNSFLKKTNHLDCEEFRVVTPTLVYMYSEHCTLCVLVVND